MQHQVIIKLYYLILLQVTLEKINREMPGCGVSVQAPVSSFKSLEESGFVLDPNGIRVMGISFKIIYEHGGFEPPTLRTGI